VNKIKFVNSKSFQSLDKLKYLDLKDNVCIDETFTDQAQIVRSQQKLNDKCGFDEPKPNSNSNTVVVVATVICCGIVLIVIAMFVYWKFYWKKSETKPTTKINKKPDSPTAERENNYKSITILCHS
jgi:hypothetical protein